METMRERLSRVGGLRDGDLYDIGGGKRGLLVREDPATGGMILQGRTGRTVVVSRVFPTGCELVAEDGGAARLRVVGTARRGDAPVLVATRADDPQRVEFDLDLKALLKNVDAVRIDGGEPAAPAAGATVPARGGRGFAARVMERAERLGVGTGPRHPADGIVETVAARLQGGAERLSIGPTLAGSLIEEMEEGGEAAVSKAMRTLTVPENGLWIEVGGEDKLNFLLGDTPYTAVLAVRAPEVGPDAVSVFVLREGDGETVVAEPCSVVLRPTGAQVNAIGSADGGTPARYDGDLVEWSYMLVVAVGFFRRDDRLATHPADGDPGTAVVDDVRYLDEARQAEPSASLKSISLLRVGERLPPEWQKLYRTIDARQGGGALAMGRDAGIILATGLPGMSDAEVKSARQAPLELGLLRHGDALFLVIRAHGYATLDLPYDHRLPPPDQRGLPDREPHQGFAVNLFGLDTRTSVLRAMRRASVTPEFSAVLEAEIRHLDARIGAPDWSYARDVEAAYRRWPSPDAMLRACRYRETAGMPFPDDRPEPPKGPGIN